MGGGGGGGEQEEKFNLHIMGRICNMNQINAIHRMALIFTPVFNVIH